MTEHGAGGDDQAVDGYLEALASRAPVPGGGSAAALVGAVAAALVAMVGRVTLGRPSLATTDDAVARMITEADEARATLRRAMDEDEAAFSRVIASYRLPRATEDEKRARRMAITIAAQEATVPPLVVARTSRRILDLALVAAAHGNPTVVSDAAVAAWAGAAAIRASAVNVRVNLGAVRDEAFAAAAEAELGQLVAESERIAVTIESAAMARVR